MKRPRHALSDAAGDAQAREGAGSRPEGDESDLTLFHLGLFERLVEHAQNAFRMAASHMFDAPREQPPIPKERDGAVFLRRVERKNGGRKRVGHGKFLLNP